MEHLPGLSSSDRSLGRAGHSGIECDGFIAAIFLQLSVVNFCIMAGIHLSWPEQKTAVTKIINKDDWHARYPSSTAVSPPEGKSPLGQRHHRTPAWLWQESGRAAARRSAQLSKPARFQPGPYQPDRHEPALVLRGHAQRG